MTPFATITEEDIVGKTDHHGDYTVTGGCSAQSSWLSEVIEQLKAIASLPDGWDSHSAPTPDIRKVRDAASLIACLADDPDLPKPYVNPTRDGGVQFEWEVGSRYFELEIEDKRAATFLYSDDAEKVEETGYVFEKDSLCDVLAYIHRVGSTI